MSFRNRLHESAKAKERKEKKTQKASSKYSRMKAQSKISSNQWKKNPLKWTISLRHTKSSTKKQITKIQIIEKTRQILHETLQ